MHACVCVCVRCHSDVKPFMCEGNDPTIFSTFNGGSSMLKRCMDHIGGPHTLVICGTWMKRGGERGGETVNWREERCIRSRAWKVTQVDVPFEGVLV